MSKGKSMSRYPSLSVEGGGTRDRVACGDSIATCGPGEDRSAR